MSRTAAAKNSKRDGLYFCIIASAFLAGFIQSDKLLMCFPYLQELSGEKFLICALPVTAAFIFSSSYLGLLLLPFSAFIAGAVSYVPFQEAYVSYISGLGLQTVKLGLWLAVLTVFAYVSVRGMESSEIIITALCSGGTGLRSDYKKVYIPLMLSSLALIIGLGCIGG